ncbi:MAG: diguanylate cyclase [Alphaproteobacteria bacterium]|nr:diguanylate cyclase [Alphaproteobacteria bacterium]
MSGRDAAKLPTTSGSAESAPSSLDQVRGLLHLDCVAITRRHGNDVAVLETSGNSAHLSFIARQQIPARADTGPLVIADTACGRMQSGPTRFYAAIPLADGTASPALTLHLCDGRPRSAAMAHRLEALAIEVTSRATIGLLSRQLAEQRAELQAQHDRFEKASETARIGIWECDLSDESLKWTAGVYDIFEMPRGIAIDRQTTLAHYTDASRMAMAEARAEAIAQCSNFCVETEIITTTGKRRWMRLTGTVEARDGQAVRIFGMKQDITEQKLLADRTRYLAETDVMTGLANRSLFQNRLTRASDSTGQGQLSALLLVDLDGFKQINDSHGHALGDKCLIEAANRLAACCDGAEMVARIGGDEFAVLVGAAMSAREIEVLADTIVAAISRPLQLDGQPIALGASVGVAHCVGDAPEDLFRRADFALYAAKSAGRNTSRVFSSQAKAS